MKKINERTVIKVSQIVMKVRRKRSRPQNVEKKRSSNEAKILGIESDQSRNT